MGCGRTKDLHFWLTEPKVFLKGTSVPMNTKSEGGALAKKRIFKKKTQKHFFGLFISKLYAAHNNWSK